MQYQRRDEWNALRIVAGFLFAPLVAPVVLAVGADSSEPLSLWKIGKYFPLFSLLTYLVTAIVGIPLYLWFRHRQIRKFWPYPLVGLAVGSMIFLLLEMFVYAWYADLELGVALGIAGTLTTCVFWVIAVWRPEDS